MRRNQRIFTILVMAGVMLACLPTLPQAAPAIPTFDPNSINTSIVLTADAAFTQTALVLPPTETPTAIPPTESPTASPSPTFLFLLPTITVPPTKATPGSSNERYACQVLSQDPPNESAVLPKNSFTVTWEVYNIGTDAWFENNTDYFFSSGERMHNTAGYDFEETVPSGGTVKLSAKMTAPNASGTYKTIWRIRVGKNEFCPMNLTIVVN